MNAAPREIRRIRHESKVRRLMVRSVQWLTPRMLRIVAGGEELAGFRSDGFDDHVKVFIPEAGSDLVLPVMGPNGPSYPAGARPPTLRDYTPRRYDAQRNELSIDFVIHESGPATAWAARAQSGQAFGVGGPRGSAIIPTEFEWHLLVGDETALPAIGRRLEELPRSARAIAVIEVDDNADQQQIESAASIEVIWVHRNGAAPGTTDPLLTALRAVTFPGADYFGWVAAETNVARALRKYLLEERGADKRWIKAAGYWRKGAVGAHEPIQE